MAVFLLTLAIFGLAVLGLALGWLLNNKTLRGSCGGLSAIPGFEKEQCSCSSPCEKRLQREKLAREQQLSAPTEEKVIEFKQ